MYVTQSHPNERAETPRLTHILNQGLPRIITGTLKIFKKRKTRNLPNLSAAESAKCCYRTVEFVTLIEKAGVPQHRMGTNVSMA